MKKSLKLLSLLLSTSLASQMISSVNINATKDSITFYDVKNNILDLKAYDAELDTNHDGNMNVFDVIRANKTLIQEESYTDLKEKVYMLETQIESLYQKLNEKTDTEEGKQLSSNDYTDEEKQKLEILSNYDDTKINQKIDSLVQEAYEEKKDIEADINNKVDKEEGKLLSSNDYTDEEKQKLESLNNYDDTDIKNEINAMDEHYISLYDDVQELKNKTENVSPVFHVGINCDYTKITECISEAINHENSIVYVHDGVYNLVEEYGQNVLDSTSTIYGISLKNNVHIIFSSNAKVVFNYTGDNKYIHRNFSPFNGEGSFTLENATVECSNCRYCVHDERGGIDGEYHVKYLNCDMKIDNSNNPNWENTNSIGGGLGRSAEVVVDGGKYYGMITYHTDTTGKFNDYKGNIIIRNIYCYNPTEDKNIMITSPNNQDVKSINKSNVYINNVNLVKGFAIYDPIDVIDDYSWNVEIRIS